jgi:hypothetical protein
MHLTFCRYAAGGFSAGYWNTVGSKEGWAPSTFVSSRKQRAGVKSQNAGRAHSISTRDSSFVCLTFLFFIEDLMDEEDYQEVVSGGKSLVAKSDYDGLFGTSAEVSLVCSSLYSFAIVCRSFAITL